MAKHRGAPLGNKHALGSTNSGGSGRPAGWFKTACKEHMARIDIPAFWASLVEDEKARMPDRMEAALKLAEFGEGKPNQTLDVTTVHDANRPTTEALIETIRALREQLGLIGEGTPVEARE